MTSTCPKCTAPSPNGTSCPRCGLVFANWKGAERAPLPMEPLRAAAPGPQLPPRAIAIGGGIAGLLFLVLVVRLCGGSAPPLPVVEPGTGGLAVVEEGADPGATAEAREPSASGHQLPAADWQLPPAPLVVEAGALPAPLERGSVTVSWLTGSDGWTRAQDEQKESLAPLLALVTSGDCLVCKRLDDQVLPALEGALRDMVKVRIVPANSTEEQAVASQLGGGDGALWLTPFPGSSAVRLSLAASEEPDLLLTRLKGELQRAAQERVSRADGLQGRGEIAGALQLLHEAVVLDPELARAFALRSLAYERAGERERAVIELQAAVALGTDLPEARERLALLHLRANRNDDALAILDPLLRLSPRYGQGRAHWLRAITWQRKGDEGKAFSDAREACSLGLARACAALGK